MSRFVNIPMVSSEKYQRNFYGNPVDAERSARQYLRSGSTFYIWETEERLFAWTAIPKPKTALGVWLLVGKGVTDA